MLTAKEQLNAEECICLTTYSIALHRYDSVDSMVAEIRRISNNVDITTVKVKVELLGSKGDWSVKEEDVLRFKPGQVSLKLWSIHYTIMNCSKIL